MGTDHKEVKRTVIREHGDMLLVKVEGLFMDKYPTTGFEFWNSREAYNQKKHTEGNKIFCSNWAVNEETALNDWDRIVTYMRILYPWKYTEILHLEQFILSSQN